MTKKSPALSLVLILGIQLTSSGWPLTKADRPASSGADRAGRSGQKKTTASGSRPASRRRTSTRSRLTRALQREARTAIARDDMRGEDVQVRQAALKALGHRAGAVVVMDPHTGRIYSIVNQEWAVRKAFIPCSTIKPFAALAGLKEKIIKPTFPVAEGQSLSLSLIDALSHSDNEYFQRIGIELGLDKIRRYAAQFGLGRKTGINLLGEAPGRIPDGESVNEGGPGYATSHGHGFEVTPLQLAVFAAALANRGSFFQPRIVINEPEEHPAGDGEGGDGGSGPGPESNSYSLRRHIDIAETERLNIAAGMMGVVEFGTARGARDPTIQMAGKTGTCTGANGVRLGLFMSFATIDRPALVVVVVTNGVGQSGRTASAIAGEIYQTLADRFHLRSGRPDGDHR